MQRLLLLLIATLAARGAVPATRPNILWFVVDDMSPNFGCYGETTIETPHIDRLAREGTLFREAHVTAPVCSPCRSALITGMYQTTIGAQHHRSGRGGDRIELPAGIEMVPSILQRAGYYTCNGDSRPEEGRPGKTDYNFAWGPAVYDGTDWAGRRPDQPFFMQVQLKGGKHRDLGGWRELDRHFGETATRPNQITGLPPYYPRDPVLLRDWAHYLDSVRMTDLEVGRILERLEKEGELENTLIAFMTDHGISHARGKQFLYREGTHIAFIVRGPGVPAGVRRDDLIEHIDLAAVTLAAAGIPLPATMQARNILAPDYARRDAIFAARDRCDETMDRIRSVRTDRWLYIRNFHPRRPHLQPNAYKDAKPTLIRLRELRAVGELEPLSERILFSPTRPEEELYEWIEDRWEVHNLAGRPEHRPALEALRARVERWMEETDDRGRVPESLESYRQSMALLSRRRGGDSSVGQERAKNIELMLRWRSEGK